MPAQTNTISFNSVEKVGVKVFPSFTEYELIVQYDTEKKQLNDLDSVLDIKCEWSEDSDTIFVFSDSLQVPSQHHLHLESTEIEEEQFNRLLLTGASAFFFFLPYTAFNEKGLCYRRRKI